MKKMMIVVLILSFLLVACQKNDDSRNLLFNSDLIAVEKDGKIGYINQNEEVIIEFIYDEATAFHMGTAIVKKDDNYYLIDDEGNMLTNEGYIWLYKSEENNQVFYKKNGKVGLLSESGEIITDPLFDHIIPFSEGVAWYYQNDLYGLIDSSGDIIIEPTYKQVRPFRNGYSVVMIDQLLGLIDKEGQVILNFEYYQMYDVNDYDQLVVSDSYTNITDRIYQLIDVKTKEVLIDDAYSIEHSTGPVYHVVNENEQYLYHYKNGILEDFPHEISGFLSIYAMSLSIDSVEYDVLLNEDYEIVYQVPSENALLFITDHMDDKGFAILENSDDQVNVYTLDGMIELDVDYVMSYNDKEIIVKKNNLWGIYDNNGNVLLDFTYESIKKFDDGYYLGYLDDGVIVLDKNYTPIFDESYENIYTHFNITTWLFP